MVDPIAAIDPASIRSAAEAAQAVLQTADPVEKARLSRVLAARFRAGELEVPGVADLPERPARLDKPELVHPKSVKKRKLGSVQGRIALLHALAHIELNAINLSWDIIGRFPDVPMPAEYYADWVRIGDDESKHFLLLHERLVALGGDYGDLPAHDGLWESAIRTSTDLLARLAVVPMVLEARGLDVTPMMIEKLTELEDFDTRDRLQVIYDDEITHVASGKRWFEHLATARGHTEGQLEELWRDLVKDNFQGQVKRPFNVPGRIEADFQPSYFEPLADWYEAVEF